MQLVDLVITFILITTIIFLFVRNIRLYITNSKLTAKVLQGEIDKFVLIEKMDKELSSETKNEDGFIKFISESRDQAFKYIEDSQEAIKEFLLMMERNIEHLKNNQPKDLKYKIIIKELEEHIKRLKNLLPKDL